MAWRREKIHKGRESRDFAIVYVRDDDAWSKRLSWVMNRF